MLWLERYHVDGLRFDAVASMLYLDYSRAAGEWVPNDLGGRENLDAVEFLRTCNEAIHRALPRRRSRSPRSRRRGRGSPRRSATAASASTYKWDLGWMHDTLEYLAQGPGAPPAGTTTS